MGGEATVALDASKVNSGTGILDSLVDCCNILLYLFTDQL